STWSKENGPGPVYRKISGVGSVAEITERALNSLK
ncbi:MAG: adenylate kinase, partial [Burkholderiaceae bacterium]